MRRRRELEPPSARTGPSSPLVHSARTRALICSSSLLTDLACSAVRLQAQNAGKEDTAAHAVSEGRARDWAREARSARDAAAAKADATGPPPPPPRVEHPSDWRHYYCQTLRVQRSTHAARSAATGMEQPLPPLPPWARVAQLHLLVWWMDGGVFEVVLAAGREQVVLSVTYDATIPCAYPMYELKRRAIAAGMGGF